MMAYARDLWARAEEALESARALAEISCDGAGSRAYFAAFHAVSALFAIEEMEFSNHTAVRSAVHRELVKAGRWPAELGEAYDLLWDLREIGDYGGPNHVSREQADEAALLAERILLAVREAHPELATP